MLTPEECDRIRNETFVEAVEVFEELPSTNDYAVARAKDAEAMKPLLVLARRQTAGRGRGKNTWWSQDGALTFTLLLGREHLGPRGPAAARLSLAVGVAVCDAVLGVDPALRVRLKWPNDVLVDERKLGGILIECPSSTTGDHIVGIGLNVNNSLCEAPGEIAARAVSLVDRAKKPIAAFDILLQVLRQIENQIIQINADPYRLQQRFSELCFLTGKNVLVALGARNVAGLCVGIAESGALLVKTETGTVECIAGHVEAIDSPAQ